MFSFFNAHSMCIVFNLIVLMHIVFSTFRHCVKLGGGNECDSLSINLSSLVETAIKQVIMHTRLTEI